MADSREFTSLPPPGQSRPPSGQERAAAANRGKNERSKAINGRGYFLCEEEVSRGHTADGTLVVKVPATHKRLSKKIDPGGPREDVRHEGVAILSATQSPIFLIFYYTICVVFLPKW